MQLVEMLKDKADSFTLLLWVEIKVSHGLERKDVRFTVCVWEKDTNIYMVQESAV